MSFLEENTKRLDEMLEELEHFPDLIVELNLKFLEMESAQSKNDFSRCLIFFFFGRPYERKLKEMECN